MGEAVKQEDFDLDQPDNDQDQPDHKKAGSPDKPDTKSYIDRMKSEGLSVYKGAAEIREAQKAATAKLKEMVTARGTRGQLIDNKEYTEWDKKLQAAKTPEEAKKLLEEIEALPQEKERAAQQEKDDARELLPDDPKRKEFQKQFDKICDDNRELIGDGQVDGFKAWFQEEMRKKPTPGHLKEQIKKLEGKEITDRNGLAPRREEYAKLTTLFKKYGLGSPQESDYIKREGLSERQDFRKKIEAFEDHFAKLKDTGFYSPEMIKKHMGELLKAENPSVLADKLKEAKDVAREESEGFTHLDERLQVGGTSIRKMSEESKKKFLEYYRDTDIKTRQTTLIKKSQQEKGLNFMHALANGEACLTKHDPKYSETYSTHSVQALDQIYKDDPEALKLALQSFEHLDFMQKVEALKKHSVLAKTTKNKEELEKNLINQAIKAKLESAKGKKTISEQTEKRYLEFFNKPENFKNPDTKKPGDHKEFKKAYEILINSTPNEQYKNLAAYEERRKKFEKDLKELQKINPAISDEDLKKWQEKYDQEGWTKREKVHQEELKPKMTKEETERKQRILLGIKDSEVANDNVEKKEKITLDELIRTVTALLANKQGGEAQKEITKYMAQGNEKEQAANRKNPEFKFYYRMVNLYVLKFGLGKKREETVEKELEQELEQIVANDKETQDQILEQNIKTLHMEGVEQSERRHDKTISGQARARKESMGRVQQGSLEADLTADAYKQLGKDYMVDKEGKAKKIEQIQFKDNNVKMQEQDRFRMKRETFKEQTRLDKKEGMFTALRDKNNQEISHEMAAKLQQAELEKLEKEMAEKAQKKVDARVTSNDAQGAKIFDLNSKIAARRKAKELLDQKRHERIKAA